MWKFIIALIILGVAVGLCFWRVTSNKSDTPRESTDVVACWTKTSDLVLLSDHALKPDENNGMMWIHGTVKNVSQYRYLAVKVNFTLKDKANNVMPTGASAYVKSIEPSKKWEFKALVLDPDAVSYEPIRPVVGYR